MQNEMRDRLAEIIRNAQVNANPLTQVGYAEADALIDSGVIVLPCKIGSTVYTVERYCNTDPYENTKEIVQPWHCEECCGRRDCSFSEFRVEPHIVGSVESALNIGRYLGTYYFSTREEAEKALKEKQK